MPTTYRATLTNVGAALVADAIASGTMLTWAKMALGDGNGGAVTVDPSRTSLVNEQYRAPLNDLYRDSANPNTIVGTLVVPPETGGWTIREFGIYDNAVTPRLVAYGETPEIEKPASSAGTGINLRLRFKLVVSADANITLAPDSNEAYATIEYVKDNAVKSLSVSGRTITYTMGDGDTHTITTQDTTYNDATQSAHGLMSADDKTKLDGIQANAEVNQDAFSNVKVGNSTIQADGKTDTLELAAGTGITLTANTTTDTVLIKVTDDTYWPKSGGAITQSNIVRNKNDTWLWLNGGINWLQGGQITLYGPEYENTAYQGVVELRAVRYGNEDKKLTCFPDGRLIWSGTTLTVPRLIGTADIASQLGTDSVGNATRPIYLNQGIATVCNHELKKSVPADALFTDTVFNGGAISQTNIKRNVNNSWLWFSGGEEWNLNNGARLVLYGAEYGDESNIQGQFRLAAGNSSGSCELVGRVDGTLQWNGQNVIYTHPTTAGNKHIPAGGLSGQILKYSAAGTAAWSSLSDANIFPKPTTASGVGQLYQCGTSTAKEFTLPSGGTWFYVIECFNANSTSIGSKVGIAAGRATVSALNTSDTRSHCWAIRIA